MSSRSPILSDRCQSIDDEQTHGNDDQTQKEDRHFFGDAHTVAMHLFLTVGVQHMNNIAFLHPPEKAQS